MTWTDMPRARSGRRIGSRAIPWLALGYIVLYALGYLAKPVPASAAIWPADALRVTVRLPAPAPG